MDHQRPSPMDGVYEDVNHMPPACAMQTNMNGCEDVSMPLSVQTAAAAPPPPMTSNFKVQMWQNSRNFDSGIQSVNHSQTASVMSLHAGSQVSTMSSMMDAERPELTDVQQQKFESIVVAYGQGHEYGSRTRAISELVQLLKDPEEAVVAKALGMIHNIAKMDADRIRAEAPMLNAREVVLSLRDVLNERATSMVVVRLSMATLFQICNHDEGLQSVIEANVMCNGDIVMQLVRHSGTQANSCYKYAMLTLHSILSDKSQKPDNVEYARRLGALHTIAQWLPLEKSDKVLTVVVDLVRILCDKNNEQKMLFVSNEGVPKLVHILRKCTHENTLWRTTLFLKVLSNYEPKALVAGGATLVLAQQLGHGSSRLMMASLECLRNVSDMSFESPHEVMTCLIQLFGHPNVQTLLYTVEILANMCANNKPNKEFLIQRGAVGYLLRIARETTEYDGDPPKVEDLHERILAIVNSLCVGNDQSHEVQLQAFQEPHFLLDKLIGMRPLILRRTLQVLSKASQADANLRIFRDVRVQKQHIQHSFVSQIVRVLHCSCCQLLVNAKIEDVKVTDLIQLSLQILSSLCRDPAMLIEAASCTRHEQNMQIKDAFVFLPVFVLWHAEDDAIKKDALMFIAAIVREPEMASMFLRNAQLSSLLQHYAQSSSPQLARYADAACRMVMLGGAAPRTTMCPRNVYTTQSQSSTGAHTPLTLDTSASTSMQPSAMPSPVQKSSFEGAAEEIGQWPEDLNGLTLNDDPFVNVWTGQERPNEPTNSYSQNRVTPLPTPSSEANRSIPPWQGGGGGIGGIGPNQYQPHADPMLAPPPYSSVPPPMYDGAYYPHGSPQIPPHGGVHHAGGPPHGAPQPHQMGPHGHYPPPPHMMGYPPMHNYPYS